MGGICERYGRDFLNPSRPETRINTGLSEENGRDEGFFNKKTLGSYHCGSCPDIIIRYYLQEINNQHFASS